MPTHDARDRPLTLEPLETYMLIDSDDQYPRSFVIGLEFSGHLQRGAFEKALEATIAGEPLLTSIVRRRGVRKNAWERTAPHRLPIEWLEEETLPIAFAARRFDLRREPGFRVIAASSESGSRIFHVFHHACCDGIGGLALLGRLYAAYSRRVSPHALVEAAPVEASAIHHRHPAEDLTERLGSQREARRASRRRAWDVLTNRPARLVRNADANGSLIVDQVPFPGSITHVLDSQQTRRLKRAAQRNCGTLNDLLLCAMFRTIHEWNEAYGTDADGASYQIMVPFDLRSPQHDRLPAANLVSCVFVKQDGATCNDPVRLRRSVIDRMQFAVSSRSGLILYSSVRLLTRMPGLLRLVLRAWRTQATALVSYVGDAGRAMRVVFPKQRGRFVIGDVVLEQITATGPVRPGTAVNLTAGVYAGQLVLNLNLDPHLFTAGDCQELMRRFVDKLLEEGPSSRCDTTAREEHPVSV